MLCMENIFPDCLCLQTNSSSGKLIKVKQMMMQLVCPFNYLWFKNVDGEIDNIKISKEQELWIKQNHVLGPLYL